MTKFITYTVISEDIAKDKKWREGFIAKQDKNYKLIKQTEGLLGHFCRIEICVSNETSILFELRYPNCKVRKL